ncbi:hypothetical protein KQ910_18375 [Reyranella sp. MMS21-HV4-11]|uniref:Apea-like HEPN domain-containing protein n=1 Tax=Reyranella humidisoli TaxID=2849149 RepID=A0ABS6IMD3_9HYPH|nr:hypothetical protein [Reyranella sp. MMS21-HV4-11]MBU8875746.1 hypothetical protein [Reyranella sp. MMS21-HV4-11]
MNRPASSRTSERDWVPIFALPNVNFTTAVESKFALLCGLSDKRLQQALNQSATFAEFVSRFTDAFGRQVTPSVLLLKASAPRAFYTITALAGFRDIVAMSTIPLNRALWLQYRTLPKVAYSNTFSLYPWSPSKDEKHLVLNTSAMLAIDDVKNFQGQASPELSSHQLSADDLDAPLLSSLVDHWEKTFTRSRGRDWKQQALFRSLNMASQAAQIPTSAQVSLYDSGRAIALWVSAFEILVHPGPNQRADQYLVFELLEQVKWEITSHSHRRFDVRKKNSQKPSKRIYASWLYARLNWLRNQFLHGNAVKADMLRLPKNAGPIEYYAAPLYRLALSAFLNLSWQRPFPPVADAHAFAKHCSDLSDYMVPQRQIEDALTVARSGWRVRNDARRRA